MTNLGTLFELLSASEAAIARAEMRMPGFDRPQPFRYELRTLRANQGRLQREVRRRAGVELGVAPLVVGGVVVGALALIGLGERIYSHFTDAQRLETQTDIYQQMRAEGTDSEQAARIVFGGGTDFNDLMNKLVLLSVIGAGVYLVAKFR